MPWTSPGPSERAMAAVDAIARSRPGPPPDAERRGRRWYVPRPPADVIAAYHADGAPVPPGATVATMSDMSTVDTGGILTVTCLGRTSGIFLRAEPDGCSLVITDGPSLTVTGTGTPADGEHFVRVGSMPFNSEPHAAGFFAVIDVPNDPWWAMATAGEEDHVLKPLCLVARPKLLHDSSMQSEGLVRTPDILGGPADLSRDPDGTVRAAITGTGAVLTARLTDDVALAAHAFGMDAVPAKPDTPTNPDTADQNGPDDGTGDVDNG